MENTIRARVNESTAHIQQHTELCANKTSTILVSSESRNHAQWVQAKADVMSELDSIKRSFTTLVVNVFDEIKRELSSHAAQSRRLEHQVERILDSRNLSLNTNSQLDNVQQDIRNLHYSLLKDDNFQYLQHRAPRSSENAQKAAVPFSSCNRQLQRFLPGMHKDVVKGSVLTVSCVLYGHPSVRKTARALAVQVSCDPILALLIFCAGYFFARHFSKTLISPSIGSQHTLRSSDPFLTWPQIDLNKIRCRGLHSARLFISNFFIFKLPYDDVLAIDFTHKDLSSRYRQVVLAGGVKRELEFSMAGIQNLGIVYYLLARELQCLHRATDCRTCGYHHGVLYLNLNVQIAVKVFLEVLEWSKTIPLEIWGPEIPMLHKQPIVMRHTKYSKAARKQPKHQETTRPSTI